MSGHANFNTISGYTTLHLQPNPQVEDDIHVAGNQPVGGANDGGTGVGPQDGPQNAQVDAEAESNKALVRQLDILLARAAASATQSVDATAVKAALGEPQTSPNPSAAGGVCRKFTVHGSDEVWRKEKIVKPEPVIVRAQITLARSTSFALNVVP